MRTEVAEVDPADYRGIICIGAYAMDRLRYQATVSGKGQRNTAPAVEFLRRAMDTDGLPVGTICHSLWLLCAEATGGGWFPSGREAAELSRQLFPDAHVEEIEEGIVSRPDLTAGVVRRVTAPLRAAPA